MAQEIGRVAGAQSQRKDHDLFSDDHHLPDFLLPDDYRPAEQHPSPDQGRVVDIADVAFCGPLLGCVRRSVDDRCFEPAKTGDEYSSEQAASQRGAAT